MVGDIPWIVLWLVGQGLQSPQGEHAENDG
jgi:hypothetical protein